MIALLKELGEIDSQMRELKKRKQEIFADANDALQELSPTKINSIFYKKKKKRIVSLLNISICNESQQIRYFYTTVDLYGNYGKSLTVIDFPKVD